MNRITKKVVYKPKSDDPIDKMLAEFLNANGGSPVKFSRMGGGFYMFGNKKIYAKIINGKLVIRVGGGYMGIEEFMRYYAEQELHRMMRMDDVEAAGGLKFEYGDTDKTERMHSK